MSLWRPKSIEKIIEESDEHKFKRSLGPMALMLFGIGGIIWSLHPFRSVGAHD